jgi:hypothetical protein
MRNGGERSSTPTTNALTVVAVGVVLLIGVVLGLYYLAHKPITPAQALAAVQTLANLAATLVAAGVCGAVGRRLLSLWLGEALEGWSVSEYAVVAFALGCGAVGLSILVLGLLGWLYPLVAWTLAVGLLAWLRRDLRGWLNDLRLAAEQLAPSNSTDWLAAAFVGLLLGLGLLRALAPPVTWDALVYHLTLPAIYVRTHGLRVNTADFNLFSGMPGLTEMLYTFAGLLRVEATEGAIAAQMLGWLFGAALCLGLAFCAGDLGMLAWVAPAILLSSTSVALELAWAYADLPLMLMALACLLALRQWRRYRQAGEPARRWLALAGAFAGLACGCKYTGAIIPLAGAVLVAAVAIFETADSGLRRAWGGLKAAAVFGGLAALTFGPWLIKNWYYTGSPLYPLLWPAADMDALRLWFYNRPDLATPPLAALAVFVRATFLGVQGGNAFDATLGPLLLLCAALLLFDWWVLGATARDALKPWLIFVAVAYLGWVALVQYSALARQSRLFFAFLPALALVGAAGLAGVRGLNTPGLRLSLIVNAVFALVLGLSAVELGIDFVSHSPLPYLAGVQTADDYTAAQLGWYQPALAGVNALPAGSRVLFLWEARSYACASKITCVPDVVIDRWWHGRRTLGTAAQILASWRAQSDNYVLIYNTGARFIQDSDSNGYDPSDWTELDRLRALLKPVAAYGETYSLYALP